LRYYETIFIIFFFLRNLIIGFAQTDSLIFYPINNPVLQQYDIRKIAAAKDGKLWLSTGNGLLSFDGNDINSFLPKENDSTSLSGHSLSRTFIDKHGNIYAIIIADGQIDYLNTTTGRAKRLKLKLEKEDSSGYNLAFPFLDMYIDKDSIFWAGRTNMGFIKYNQLSKRTFSYSLLSASNPLGNTVFAIRGDAGNEELLWLATNNGIYSFNKRTNQLKRNFKCSSPGDSTEADIDLRDMDVKNTDTIWFVSHLRGVGCYEIKTGRYTIFPFHRKNMKEEERLFVFSLQQLNNNSYLLGLGNRSPWIFNTLTRQYNFKSRIAPDLPAMETYQTIADRRGNIWFLLYGKLYLAKQDRNRFTSIPIRDSHYKDQNFNVFKKVIWDERRNFYYAAYHLSDGIFVFDKNMQPVRTILGPPFNTPSFGLIESVVIDIGIDKNGMLWMCGDIVTLYDSLQQKMVPVNQLYPQLKSLNQRFRNFVFRGNYIYALPANASSRYLYRIDIDKFICDSIFLSGVIPSEKQPPNQLGPLEMDSLGKNVYISNKNIVFQYNLSTAKTRKIIELTDLDKAYAHRSDFHWYNLDDDDNLWVSSLSKTWIFEPSHLKIIKLIERQKNTYFNQAYNIKGKGIMCYVNSTSYDLYDYKNLKQYKLSINDGLISYLNWSTAYANGLLFVGAFNYLQYIPLASVINKKSERSCYLSDIKLFNYNYPTDTLPEYLRSLKLPYNKNFITLTFSSTEFERPEVLEYRYILDGVDRNWVYTNYLNRTISYNDLKPGNYIFHISIKNFDGNWNDNKPLQITIIPAWWQTNWFRVASFVLFTVLALWLIRWRIKSVRKQEQTKSRIEKEMLELEAKALRAQMNPHFIFNCLNSIKSLIQQHEEEKSINYLTTFSKLIRTLFNNADKKEISLYDEIETCKLYMQLEAMRFDTRFSFAVNSDENIDLKSISVPALIIQPFIENAIWHGIVPRSTGGHVSLNLARRNGSVEIIIDDDGIGREVSLQNKSTSGMTHQSKGVNLTQSRLELDNLLQQRKASIEIIDKKDENGKASGTKVTITINEEI
jgi:two-component sensor histidine kinase